MNGEAKQTGENKSSKNGNTYEVKVFAPRNPLDQRPYSWSKHLTVGEAASQAAPAFGIVGGQPTLAKASTALDRSKQLVAAGVRDGDVLEIVDAAGGV